MIDLDLLFEALAQLHRGDACHVFRLVAVSCGAAGGEEYDQEAARAALHRMSAEERETLADYLHDLLQPPEGRWPQGAHVFSPFRVGRRCF